MTAFNDAAPRTVHPRPHASSARSLGLGLALALLVLACSEDALTGLAETPPDDRGPAVVFEPLHEPDPIVPFPNDLAIRVAPDGQRFINTSLEGPTAYERRFREHFNEVPGFSAMSPIQVEFDGPLDLWTVTDDTVFVVNVEEGSDRYGEIVPLDLGRGWFPHDAEPHAYFPNDPLAADNQFVLPPDNIVDTDGDGTPDQRVYHYEVSTDTLDIRPLLPLEAGSRYAVVLTRGIQGTNADGDKGPIRSPFAFVTHGSQANEVGRALPFLEARGVAREDVAFGWTFTTGDLSRTFNSLRAGLYGEGPFGWLDESYPPGFVDVFDTDIDFDGIPNGEPGGHKTKDYPAVERDHRYILQGAYLDGILSLIGQFQSGDFGSFDHTDYAVFGEMEGPSFRATEDNIWELNIEDGTIVHEAERIPWLLTVPKTTEQHKPPFPVVLHAHATGTSRIEALLLADKLAQAGIAVFSIDAVGHGPLLTDAKRQILENVDELIPGGTADETILVALLRTLLGPLLYADYEKELPADLGLDELIDTALDHGFMQQLAGRGRAVDDNGDCRVNGTPGEAYYTPDPFRLRDAMRQTTFDYMVAVRTLRSLSQARVDELGGGLADVRAASKDALMPYLLAGDFNADGVLDVGGPDVPYFMTGVSLGGIHTALTAPLEDHIVAAVPIVAGAGVGDIFVRTNLQQVVAELMKLASGPVVAGCPNGGGGVDLSWNNESDRCSKQTRPVYTDETTGECVAVGIPVPVARDTINVAKDDTVRVTNLDNGEVRETLAGDDGAFMVAVPSDKGDRVLVEVVDSAGSVTASSELVSPTKGVAKPRNTPDFRETARNVSNILEGSDAITVADRVYRKPLPGKPATRMLLTLAVGDGTVNFAAGLALARAVGLFGDDADLNAPDASYRAWTESMIDRGALREPIVGPDLLDPAKPDNGPGLCSRVATDDGGLSAVCLADVNGHHEYIAQASGGRDQFPTFERGGVTYEDGTYTEYHRNMMAQYFHSLGTYINEDLCWGSKTCVADNALDAEWDGPVAER